MRRIRVRTIGLILVCMSVGVVIAWGVTPSVAIEPEQGLLFVAMLTPAAGTLTATGLQQHQDVVQDLEQLGFNLAYALDENAPSAEQVPGFLNSSAYVRNSLAGKVVVPVVEIHSPESTRPIRLRDLLRFPDLRRLDLSHAEFSEEELLLLASLKDLELLVLPNEAVAVKEREVLQQALPALEFCFGKESTLRQSFSFNISTLR